MGVENPRLELRTLQTLLSTQSVSSEQFVDMDASVENGKIAQSADKGSLPLQNSYAAKKTIAQGMMDVALIMANANQMRFVLEYCSTSGTYTFVLALIIASLVLQVNRRFYMYDFQNESPLLDMVLTKLLYFEMP